MNDPTQIRESKLQHWRYDSVPDHWDEALKPTGFPRAHWRKLASAFGRMGRQQFNRRWQIGQQLIQSNGVSYNVYGDANGRDRPWSLDPIPLVISEGEWAGIERAVVQRATLLNTILADLYGPRRLIQERLLPPELMHANPGFPRPCFGIRVPGNVFLHSYAVDVARSPNGAWWVIRDRTQAPSGAGYALENRLVSARTFPAVFSQLSVRQLVRYFDASRDGLLSLAGGGRRIVLLTPGPHNETYFEHSYLAKFWGFPLVEGADLTVRDNRVFLKTLGGLEPVDLILRRQDDAYCDPLELRGDSLLGVAGLVQAVRAGNVVVANALGSGLMESAAHMAFLPGLCRTLLGEDLAMPSVATWWCGQESARRYVLNHMGELVIRPAFPRFGMRPVFGAELDAASRAELARKIGAQPEQYVAQEQVALSTAPVWSDRGLAARHVVMRLFACWDGAGYTVMPGGLTRVSNKQSSLVVSMQQGGGSKDTWVLGAGEDPPGRVSSESSNPPPSGLPSRVADNLFWLGRYAERTESTVRLVRVLLPALSGEADFGQEVTLETGMAMLAAYQYVPEAVLSNSVAEQRRLMERVLTTLLQDSSEAVGIAWLLKQVRRAGRQLKDRLSADTWRVLQDLERDFGRPAHPNPEQRLAAQMDLLDRAILSLSAFSGLVMESTTRGHGWLFLDIGRRLERALQMIELLKHTVAETSAEPDAFLEMLLHIADSSMTYRTRNLASPRADLVLDLLLADETNPRSLVFQVVTLNEHVDRLPEREPRGRHSLEKRLVLKALTNIRLAHLDELAEAGDDGRRAALARFLRALDTDLLDFSDALTGKYLSHVMPSRLLAAF